MARTIEFGLIASLIAVSVVAAFTAMKTNDQRYQLVEVNAGQRYVIDHELTFDDCNPQAKGMRYCQLEVK